jgi:putative secretion ATPase (PEP-CTERM system associated)
MYERFYQLRERPFALSPDPDYLYPSRVHQEALDYLRYGLESQAGFIVITGEIGSGKTTLLQTLLRNVDSGTTVGRIVNTMLEPRELLETIMIDFGLDPAGKSKPLLLRDLSQYLVDQRLAGRNVLVVIDEAQNLSLGALEELRMLSNLETEKSKLLQIVLVGQPNLRDKLAAPELEQLRQRITVSYHLPPLDADETGNYINHRLRRAATGAPLEFPREATDLIHARSRGVPRIINVICDAALVFGYAEERRTFDAGTIAEVLTELEATGVLPANRDEKAPAAGATRAEDPASRPAAPPAAASPAPVAVAPAVNPAPAAVAQRVSPAPAAARGVGPAPYEAPASTGAAAVRANAAAATMAPPVSTARVTALDERERHLQQRERELAEQRRVLAEEYRLLRARAAAQAAAPVARPAVAARFESTPREGFWQWLKRIMLGVSTS